MIKLSAVAVAVAVAVAIVIGTVIYFANNPVNFETEAPVIGCEIFVGTAVSISLRG